MQTGRCLCLECNQSFRRIVELRDHLSSNHSFIFRTEILEFENRRGLYSTEHKLRSLTGCSLLPDFATEYASCLCFFPSMHFPSETDLLNLYFQRCFRKPLSLCVSMESKSQKRTGCFEIRKRCSNGTDLIIHKPRTSCRRSRNNLPFKERSQVFRQNISSVSFREALKCKNISNFVAHAVGQTTKPLHISLNSLKILYFRIRKSFIRKSGELERKGYLLSMQQKWYLQENKDRETQNEVFR